MYFKRNIIFTGGIFLKYFKNLFEYFRAAPSPTPSPNLNDNPPIPNRFRHPDLSTASDDEMSNSSGSRRSSSNDDQVSVLLFIT